MPDSLLSLPSGFLPCSSQPQDLGIYWGINKYLMALPLGLGLPALLVLSASLALSLPSLQPGCSGIWWKRGSHPLLPPFPCRDLLEWKLPRHNLLPWATVSRVEIHAAPEKGWSALAQQPGAASSFPGLVFVFKFLRPVSALPTAESAGPRLAFTSFLSLLDQAGLQGGAPGQASPSHCPPVRARELASWGDGKLVGHGRGSPAAFQTS